MAYPREPVLGRYGDLSFWAVAVVALGAILFQVYVPLVFTYGAYVEMPFLVTVYIAIVKRSQTAGLFTGALIGLMQDALSAHPLGIFGIVKSVIGYFSASVSLRVEVENPVARFILVFFFLLIHQAIYVLVTGALLGITSSWSWGSTALVGLLNAIIGVTLYQLLDRFRSRLD